MFGWRGQIVRLMAWQRLKQNEQKTIGKLQAQQRVARQLLLSLAVRAYELEKGQPPNQVTDLVPLYIKAVPQDPLTGTGIGFTLASLRRRLQINNSRIVGHFRHHETTVDQTATAFQRSGENTSPGF